MTVNKCFAGETNTHVVIFSEVTIRLSDVFIANKHAVWAEAITIPGKIHLLYPGLGKAAKSPERVNARDRVIDKFVEEFFVANNRLPNINNLTRYLSRVSESNGGRSDTIIAMHGSTLEWTNCSGQIMETKLSSLKVTLTKRKKHFKLQNLSIFEA